MCTCRMWPFKLFYLHYICTSRISTQFHYKMPHRMPITPRVNTYSHCTCRMLHYNECYLWTCSISANSPRCRAAWATINNCSLWVYWLKCQDTWTLTVAVPIGPPDIATRTILASDSPWNREGHDWFFFFSDLLIYWLLYNVPDSINCVCLTELIKMYSNTMLFPGFPVETQLCNCNRHTPPPDNFFPTH